MILNFFSVNSYHTCEIKVKFEVAKGKKLKIIKKSIFLIIVIKTLLKTIKNFKLFYKFALRTFGVTPLTLTLLSNLYVTNHVNLENFKEYDGNSRINPSTPKLSIIRFVLI